MNGLTIGKLAKQAGVNIDTVRYYERSGLLPKAPRSTGGYRLYTDNDSDRLRFIRRAKALGFSLDEIAELIALNAGKGNRGSVRKLAQHRVEVLDHRIAELTSIRDALALLVQRCSGTGPVKGCPIIENVLAQNIAACHQEQTQ